MVHRVSWLRKHLGLGAGCIVDAHACDVPPSRKLPGLFSQARETPATTGRRFADTEGAKLSDLIEDMDRARVTASLVVLDEEPEEFLRLAAQHPGRLFGLVYYDSLSPRQGLERVRASRDDHPDLILGVTTAMPRFRQDPRLKDFVPLYAYCGERGLPIQFHGEADPTGAETRQPVAFAVLAKSYPRLKVVCRSSGSWRGQALELLHRFPNLFLLVDGFHGVEADAIGAARSPLTLPYAAGSRKLLFGSDWQGREPGYFQRIEAARRLPWRYRQNVGWRTAAHVYGPRILSPASRAHPQPSSR